MTAYERWIPAVMMTLWAAVGVIDGIAFGPWAFLVAPWAGGTWLLGTYIGGRL